MSEQNSVVTETKEMKAAVESTRGLCNQSLELKVDSPESFQKAIDIRILLSKAKEKILENYQPVVDRAMDAKRTAEEVRKEAVILRDKVLLPFVTADNHLKSQREIYNTEQEILHAIAEKKKQDLLDIKAAKEKEKLDKEAADLKEKADKLKEEGKEDQAEVIEEQAKEKIEQKEDVFSQVASVEKKVESTHKTEDRTTFFQEVTDITVPQTENEKKAFIKDILEDKNFNTDCIKFSLSDIKTCVKAKKLKGSVSGVKIIIRKEERMRKK